MANNVTKAEIISQAAESANLTKAATEKVMNSILSSIEKALVAGKNVTLVGFGTFTTASRKAREGRNPRTGDKLTIPKATVAKFRPGKQLKGAVNK